MNCISLIWFYFFYCSLWNSVLLCAPLCKNFLQKFSDRTKIYLLYVVGFEELKIIEKNIWYSYWINEVTILTMKMKRLLFAMLLLSICAFQSVAADKNSKEKSDSIKTGWNFGALPAISFDTDLGFQYGALVNFFDYLQLFKANNV